MTKDDHKAALLKAKTRKEVAQARRAELDVEACKIDLERVIEKRAKELAENDQHKVYVFDKPVAENSVKACITQLVLWSRQDPGCDIELQVNSPGGVIFDGFALIDFLRGLRADGHKITAVTYGMAASMAGVILQAADERVMGQNAFLLIHEGSLGAIGDFGDVEDRVELMGLMHDRILSLFEGRAKAINPKTTKAFIRNRWKRKDWWLTADEAARLGFVDEVR